MNKMNLEELTRYVPLAQCDYIVDQDRVEATELEPRYKQLPDWKPLLCDDFLEPTRSHPLFRAFYVPFLSPKVRAHWRGTTGACEADSSCSQARRRRVAQWTLT